MNTDRDRCDGSCQEECGCLCIYTPRVPATFARTTSGTDAAFRDADYACAVEIPAPLGPIGKAIESVGGMRFRFWLLAMVVAGLIGFALGGCGGGDPEPEHTPPTEKRQ